MTLPIAPSAIIHLKATLPPLEPEINWHTLLQALLWVSPSGARALITRQLMHRILDPISLGSVSLLHCLLWARVISFPFPIPIAPLIMGPQSNIANNKPMVRARLLASKNNTSLSSRSGLFTVEWGDFIKNVPCSWLTEAHDSHEEDDGAKLNLVCTRTVKQVSSVLELTWLGRASAIHLLPTPSSVPWCQGGSL